MSGNGIDILTIDKTGSRKTKQKSDPVSMPCHPRA